MSTTPWNLNLIPDVLRDQAVEAIDAGDVEGWLSKASNDVSTYIVAHNMEPLRERELLERAVVQAMQMIRGNNHHLYGRLDALFSGCDRARLLAVGDPLPGVGPWTLYRGVGGLGRARRLRGYSWTADREVAEWFARRAHLNGLSAPAVVSATAHAGDVLFYTNAREEREFVLQLPPTAKVTTVAVGIENLNALDDNDLGG